MARKLNTAELGSELAGAFHPPSLVALPGGGYAMLGPLGVQKYDVTGQAVGEPFPVPAWATTIVVRGDVIYAMGLEPDDAGPRSQSISAQAFTLYGAAFGTAFYVVPPNEDFMTPPAAVTLPDGRIAVVYSQQNTGAFVSFIEPNGNVSETEMINWLPQTYITGLSVSQSGGFIVDFVAYAQVGQWSFTADGEPNEAADALLPASFQTPLANGGHVIVYRKGEQIIVQEFGSDGLAVTDPYPVGESSLGIGAVIVTALEDGTFAIAWGEVFDNADGLRVAEYRSAILGRFNRDSDASDGDDDLIGTAGNDHILGLAGHDVLFGRAGNDVLDGGAGADQMYGGAGNDVYIVDHVDDEVGELSDEGFDQVWASVNYALSAHVERLVLTGTANLTGTGNALANRLVGNDGDNILDGGVGADQMRGGLGNDIYIVDNENDRIYEYKDEGFDEVWSSVSYDLRGTHVERLVLTGSAYIATGNSLANRLVGNDANNLLDGGGGADQMRGGLGDDNYIVDHRQDRIYEYADEGYDRVFASANYSLVGTHVESLTLLGSATYGIGNSLGNLIIGTDGFNVIDGGAGDDLIIGGRGQDRLTGGEGVDYFVFESLADSAVGSSDRITDLEAHDIINISAIDADITTANDQAFVFVDSFSGQAGQATLSFADGVTFLNLDVDGDGRSDFLLRLQGDHRAHEGWVL